MGSTHDFTGYVFVLILSWEESVGRVWISWNDFTGDYNDSNLKKRYWIGLL